MAYHEPSHLDLQCLQFQALLCLALYRLRNVMILNNRVLINIAVITVKLKESTKSRSHSKNADGMVNSADPEEQSDLGLHCLPRPLRPRN